MLPDIRHSDYIVLLLLGSIKDAISQARRVGGFSLLIDVEVSTEGEANEAIDAGADIIMLDNMEGQELVGVATRLKEEWLGKRKFLLETSGGIEEHNLHERAINGMCRPHKPLSILTLYSDRHPEHKCRASVCTSHRF